MKVTVNTKKLQSILNRGVHCVNKNGIDPRTCNFELKVDEDLSIRATDGVYYFTGTLEAEIEGKSGSEPFKGLIDAVKLKNVITNVADEKVSLDIQESKMIIKAKNTRHTLLFVTGEMPSEEPTEPKWEIKLQGGEFKRVSGLVNPDASRETYKYIQIAKDGIFSCHDTYSSWLRKDFKLDFEPVFISPSISKFFDKEEVTIAFNRLRFLLKGDDWQVSGVMGYVDTYNIRPTFEKNAAFRFIVDTKLFQEAVKNAMINVEDLNPSVMITFNKQGLKIFGAQAGNETETLIPIEESNFPDLTYSMEMLPKLLALLGNAALKSKMILGYSGCKDAIWLIEDNFLAGFAPRTIRADSILEEDVPEFVKEELKERRTKVPESKDEAAAQLEELLQVVKKYKNKNYWDVLKSLLARYEFVHGVKPLGEKK